MRKHLASLALVTFVWVAGLGSMGLVLLVRAQNIPADQIPLSQAVMYGTDVRSWPATIAVTAVETAPGADKGVYLEFDRARMNARWPDVLNWPPDGYLQWTLFACVPIQGTWHCGGVHEFWSDRKGAPRVWSGANLLETAGDGRNNWQANWAYDGRWGRMQEFVPVEGSRVAFFAVAGALRPGTSDHQTVQERSNVVLVDGLKLQGRWTAAGTSQPPPPPPPPRELTDEEIRASFDNVDRNVEHIHRRIEAAELETAALQARIEELLARIAALEARPSFTQCEVSVNLGFARIPARCTLK
jgi:hypothetical protein